MDNISVECCECIIYYSMEHKIDGLKYYIHKYKYQSENNINKARRDDKSPSHQQPN